MRSLGTFLLGSLFLCCAAVAVAIEVPASEDSRSSGPRVRRALVARLLLADGAPASGFTISVAGGALTVRCAPDGSFQLDPAPPLPFWIVAAGPDGELLPPIEIRWLESARVDIQLPYVARDNVTVVSGVAPGLDLLAASAATSVTAEALEQRPPQRIVDALESVAGASKLGDGADSVPVLRGLARGRTLILVDGARVTSERRAGPSATFVDPADLAALEVLRGPGSVVYGSDAFGGVLNAVTRDPDAGERGGRIALEGATGGREQVAGSASLSTPVARGAILVEVRRSDAADAAAGGGGRIYNSGFASAGGSLRWLVPAGRGQFRASLQTDRVDDLGKAAIDSRSVRSYYPREDSDRLTLAWLGVPSRTWDALESTLFVGDYRIVLDRDRVSTATSTRRIDRSDTAARDGQLRVVAGRELGGGRLQIGLDAHSRFGLTAEVGRIDFAVDSTTEVAHATSTAIGDARRISTGLFATWTVPFGERWSAGAGIRGDRVTTRNRGGFFGDRSEASASLSGNLSVTMAPAPGWSATAQVARGFRVPTLSDRYYRGPSGRGFVIGNPDLDPETSLQVDLAIRRTRGRASVALYAYRYRIEDLVERYRTGDDFFFRNRGSATVEGIELEAQARLDERWSLDGGAAWGRGTTGGGDFLDDQPAANLFVGGRYAERRGYLLARLAIHDRKRNPGPTEVRRPAFLLVDLGVGRQLSSAFELRLLVQNVLDRRFTASPDESADRAPGRSLSLALSGRF